MSRKSLTVVSAVAVLMVIAISVYAVTNAPSPSQSTPQRVGGFATVLNQMEPGEWVPFCVQVDAVKSVNEVTVTPSAGHMSEFFVSRTGPNAYCGRYYSPTRVAKPTVAYMRLKSHGQLLAEYQFRLVPEPPRPW